MIMSSIICIIIYICIIRLRLNTRYTLIIDEATHHTIHSSTQRSGGDIVYDGGVGSGIVETGLKAYIWDGSEEI